MEAFIPDQKKKLRSHFLKKRNSISELEYKNLNKCLKKIAFHFLSSYNFSKIFIFHPLLNEPDLRPLIDLDAFCGITFGLPVLASKEKMSFFEWTKKTTLKKNQFGIFEPDPFFAKEISPDEKTTILIPSLALDKKGTRLGMGGGFYDRYLEQNKKAFKIGVAFSEFLIESLPKEDHDIKMDAVLTEEDFIVF